MRVNAAVFPLSCPSGGKMNAPVPLRTRGAAVLVIGDEISVRADAGHQHRLHRALARADRHSGARGTHSQRRRGRDRGGGHGAERALRLCIYHRRHRAHARRHSPPTASRGPSMSASAITRSPLPNSRRVIPQARSAPSMKRASAWPRIPFGAAIGAQRDVGGAGLSDRQRLRHGRHPGRDAVDAGGYSAAVGGRRQNSRHGRSAFTLARGGSRTALAAVQKQFPDVPLGSYPFTRDGRFGTSLVARGNDERRLAEAAAALKAMIVEAGGEPVEGDPV